MAKRPPGATLPVLSVRGSHEELGRAMGAFRAPQIRRSVDVAKASFWDAELSKHELERQIAPYLDAAERIFPQYVRELRAMATSADVPFEVLFRLNCYESRPPGTPPGSVAGPAPPADQPTAATQPPTKDPGVLLADGCTSVVSRGQGTIVVGHTEDSSPEAVEGIYLLDATIEEDGETVARFMALNYAQTLPGCAAAMNQDGLIVLIDALPDPHHRVGAPRHFVSRALLGCKDVDAAIDLLVKIERGGGWNYLLVQGERYANVETSATHVSVTADGIEPAYAHANHYLDEQLASDAGEPRPNSISRLSRAQALMTGGLSVDGMKALLADRQGFPDSICRERTIAALVANSADQTIQVCWGEPEQPTWTAYSL